VEEIKCIVCRIFVGEKLGNYIHLFLPWKIVSLSPKKKIFGFLSFQNFQKINLEKGKNSPDIPIDHLISSESFDIPQIH